MSEGAGFVDGWKHQTDLLLANAKSASIAGADPIRRRIDKITDGRCRFVVENDASDLAFESSVIRIGSIRIEVFRWAGSTVCETITQRTKVHHHSLYIPLEHAFDAKQDDDWTTVRPGKGLILSGPGETRRRWNGASSILNIMIDRDALDQQLMLSATPSDTNGGLPKTSVIEFGRFPTLVNFLTLLLSELNNAESFFQERPTGEASETLVPELTVRLLLQLIIAAARETYAGQSVRSRHVVVPAYVRAAERFMRENYAEKIDMSRVANACQISVRTLQSGFQKYRDTTPNEFLRSVRLTRARSDLVVRPEVTIASVASSVGYRSHSQFTRDYRNMFGESPKTTRSGGG